jgi:integrase
MSVHKLNNGNWCFRKRITLTDGTIKNIQRTYKTKKEAQLQEQLYKVSNDEIEELTFNDVYLHYLDYKKSRVKKITYYNLKKLIDKLIIPRFGTIQINKISTLDIINWQSELNELTYLTEKKKEKKYSSNYKAKVYTYFKAIEEHALKHFNMEKNPAMLVENFKRSKLDRKVNFWTYNEFEQFIKVVDDQLYNLLFSTLYFTGIRKGEAQALKWNDILWQTKEIRIDETLSPSNGTGHAYCDTPKNQNALRNILLSNDLYEQIKAHYEQERLVDGFNDNCFVFGTTQFLSHSAITRQKDEYINKAKVKRIVTHDFRHSFASMMINLGVDIYALSKLMGHASIEETTQTYGHLYPSTQAKIIDRLNNKEYLNLEKKEDTKVG